MFEALLVLVVRNVGFVERLIVYSSRMPSLKLLHINGSDLDGYAPTSGHKQVFQVGMNARDAVLASNKNNLADRSRLKNNAGYAGYYTQISAY